MKETTGQAALKLQSKNEKINPIDLQREIHKGSKPEDSFEYQIFECLDRGRHMWPGEDFFIEVQIKKERLLQNVVRQYFIPKRACPSPQFDQIVYHYQARDESITFLWVIPDWGTVEKLCAFGGFVTKEQNDLIQFCRDFKSGELLKKAMVLNKENIDGKVIVC